VLWINPAIFPVNDTGHDTGIVLTPIHYNNISSASPWAKTDISTGYVKKQWRNLTICSTAMIGSNMLEMFRSRRYADY
jgi:hypothetical protein